ncbi:MAG: preprotein translocase subunit SecE [Crocinitomicaceae bacterium]|nr:preprotein translocase subunit SecE [Crocinitomicaceae bacterium]|tara:strand:- start:1491 stop:1682 length:192 start_codon:yes stop_codon:yes gene_type:complete
MSDIKKYVLESVDELRTKVTWPTWKELQGSSVLVLVASFIIAILVYLMDLGFGQLMKAVYKTF